MCKDVKFSLKSSRIIILYIFALQRVFYLNWRNPIITAIINSRMTYRISTYKSLPRIIAGLVYRPGGSWSLKLINAGPRIHTGSNWLEA